MKAKAIHTNGKWKEELNNTILKYHTIALWVAVVFDILFFVTDYINLNEYWQEFLTFRVSVSFICLIVVLFHKQLKISRELMGVIPVFLISIQNAYMWSVMDAENLQKHTFAYMAMFIGSGMFMFYHVYYSIFLVLVNIVANIIFFYFNSPLSIEEILVNGAFLTGAVAIFSILLIRMRYRLTKKEIIARFALQESKKQIEEKNEEILDSITYAKRIQTAILPPLNQIDKYLPNNFVLYKPKDIVAGDFYWLEHKDDKVFFAAADCTGHGVPGAMVSVVCNNALNRAVREHGLVNPAAILDKVVDIVVETFERSVNDVKDGMDIALCVYDNKAKELLYAGANNPLWLVTSQLRDIESTNLYQFKDSNYSLYEIKATKQPIGKFENKQPFKSHSLKVNNGDVVYLFTDGYADQFGGEKGKKFKYKPFKNLLLSIQNKTMKQQYEHIDMVFEKWKGDLEQIDDVCVIGVKF